MTSPSSRSYLKRPTKLNSRGAASYSQPALRNCSMHSATVRPG